MPRENFSDVIIIGGGPSGSFCALNVAKKAISVTVFEEHDEIGVPCHCAGHLSIEGLKSLGIYPLPNNVMENVFNGAKIYSPDGISFTIHFPSPITCAVNRALFDKYLSKLAEKAGARYFLDRKVEHLIYKGEKGFIEVIVSKKAGETFRFFSKIVVDAEGVARKLLKQAGLTSENSIVHCVNAKVENVRDVENDKVEVFLGNAFAPGFYAWLIPKGNGTAKVGLGTKIGNPRMLLRRFMKKHPAVSGRLQHVKILSENFHSIPLSGPIKKAYTDNFIVVGDAASQVKPTTGGGVIFGLNCAKIAADVVAKAMESGDFSAKTLSAYQRNFMKFLGFDVHIMRQARRLLNLMPDKYINHLIDFCRKTFTEKDLYGLEEIDFQGRVLLKMLKRPKSTLVLGYFATLILRSIFKT
jgi:digeranylgeranylglycerophospholipid reductase